MSGQTFKCCEVPTDTLMVNRSSGIHSKSVLFLDVRTKYANTRTTVAMTAKQVGALIEELQELLDTHDAFNEVQEA